MKAVLLLPLALLAAGCGSSYGSSGGGSSSSAAGGTTTAALAPANVGSAPIRTITIKETEFKLDPANVTLDKPGVYVLKGENDGHVNHAIAIEGKGLDKDGPIVGPGKVSVLKVTISKRGSYEIYCPVDSHKQMGMEGKLTLGGAPPTTVGTATTNTGKNDGSGY